LKSRGPPRLFFFPKPRLSRLFHFPPQVRLKPDTTDRSQRTNTMQPYEDYVTTDDGVRLFVQTAGNGPDVVIVPNRVYLADAFTRLADHRTVIFCDPRNRGLSDHVTDRSKLERGVGHDVDDFDAIRRHFGLDRVSLIGHSYMGLVVVLYAMKYPNHTQRVVQIGPMGPDYSKQYPAHLANADATLTEVLARLGALQQQQPSLDAAQFCRTFWSILRALYVVDPADADRLRWEPCDMPNEMSFMEPWTEHVLPSIQRLQLTPDDFAKVRTPVLTVHGRKDRSSAYGGGRDWALRLPDARLLTVEGAAHVPWIEAPELVFDAIGRFLSGGWPEGAEKVEVLDRLAPGADPA
jgi:proline iminopeptidase